MGSHFTTQRVDVLLHRGLVVYIGFIFFFSFLVKGFLLFNV